jgi:hypothetical protein
MHAALEAPRFEQLNASPMTTINNPSLPKEKIKVLLLEGISETAVASLNAAGYSNV